MIFMVSSTPMFSKPEEINEAKVKFMAWMKDLQSKKKVISLYQKIGKGSVVIFDVSSNKEINELMNEWLKMVPVPITYEVIPLVSPAELQ